MLDNISRDHNEGNSPEYDNIVVSNLRKDHYGLTWEKKPSGFEMVWDAPITIGTKVQKLNPRRSSNLYSDPRIWTVEEINEDGTVYISRNTSNDNPENSKHPLENLVAVADLDEKYPYTLIEDGEVIGDKENNSYNTVINAENIRALELLTHTHAGKIDVIYIDPPYNTGAKDWKYNNNYIDNTDAYKHSKWLSFMEKRLKASKKLLNPDNSVLIVTIDEKEFLRTGLLLEQVFPEARTQMVSSVTNPKGTGRRGSFSRVNEYIFFVMIGKAVPIEKQKGLGGKIKWQGLRRSNPNNTREKTANQFYPIYIDPKTSLIVGRGDVLEKNAKVSDHVTPDGLLSVFPIRDNGVEMMWGLRDTTFDWMLDKGYVKATGKERDKPQRYVINYLMSGEVKAIEDGRLIVNRDENNVITSGEWVSTRETIPFNQWDKPSHNADKNGTLLVKAILGDNRFTYPKSLYAVEDCLRLFTSNKTEAVVLDLFGGSGTTAHAVMRLNQEDNGRRTSITISNNEVSEKEEKMFLSQGLRPNDNKWYDHGVCQHVTKPRIRSVITGKTASSNYTEDIKGKYKYNQESEMSDGFKENAKFYVISTSETKQLDQESGQSPL